MRASILLAALALLGAGCLGHCGPADTASWRQPGLHDEMAKSGLPSTTRAPTSGIPFENDTLAARYAGFSLAEVAWRSTGGGSQERPVESVSLSARPDPRIHVMVPVDWSEENVTRLFRGFLENVSDAPQRWDAWERELLGSRGVGAAMMGANGTPVPIAYTYQVAVEGPFRLAALLDEQGGAAAFEQGAYPSPGHVTLSQGPWRFALEVPVREYRLDTPDGPLVLSVDAVDQARMHHERGEGGGHARTLVLLQDALRQAGAQPAPLDEGSIGTMVC